MFANIPNFFVAEVFEPQKTKKTKIYPEITAPNKKKISFLTRAFYKIIKVKIEKTTTVQLETEKYR